MSEGVTGVHDGPRTVRVRHELRQRTLTVLRVERPAPRMVRAVLGGPDLAGFTSSGFDDHVKLFFPATDAGSGAHTGLSGIPEAEWVMRDFTPRRYDASAGELWIELFLHAAGPAAAWARQAAAGQTLMVAGPRGSAVIPVEDIDHHVLVGDETALPAIHRRLEELPAGAQAQVIIETDPDGAWPAPASRADVEIHWVAREPQCGAPAHTLVAALRRMQFPVRRCFWWVAGESHDARSLRHHLVEERGIGKRWIKAAGYWQRGASGAHERIDDE